MPYPYFNSYQQMNYPQFQQSMPQMPMNSFQNANNPPVPNIQQVSPQQAMPMQVQGGFVRVQSEDEARRYSVAPGNSITFIDENAPYCYTKSVDFSQLDRPIFKKFRLVEENEASVPSQNAKNSDLNAMTIPDMDLSSYAKNSDLDVLRAKINGIMDELDDMNTAVEKMKIDIDFISDKKPKKMIQNARKDAEEE